MEGGIDLKEDIKTLEELLKASKENDMYEGNKYFKSLEYFIKEYQDLKEIEESHRKENGELREKVKQLEEENKSKQKAYDDCYCEYKHYKQFDSIPKSKVKEKIEEIEKLKDIPHELDFKAYYRVKDIRNIEIEILQQLLEDFEETGNHIPIID